MTYVSSQETRQQKPNSSLVMNSLGDKICPHSSANKIEKYMCMHYKYISFSRSNRFIATGKNAGRLALIINF